MGVTPLLAPTLTSHLHLRRSETPLETNSGYATDYHTSTYYSVNFDRVGRVNIDLYFKTRQSDDVTASFFYSPSLECPYGIVSPYIVRVTVIIT